ncbi:MAG: hypothetical protein P8X68_03630 [Desulfobacterales bacterium]|jgi:hypothetical protein
MKDSEKIAIATVFVAACALGISIWSGIEMRRHSRLSVSPLFIIDYSLAKDDQYVGVVLSNRGLGPGRVLAFSVFVEDEKEPAGDLGFGGLILAAHKLNIDKKWLRIESPKINDPVLVNQNIPLMSIPRSERTDERIENLKEALDKIEIKVDYESLYHEKDSVTFKMH